MSSLKLKIVFLRFFINRMSFILHLTAIICACILLIPYLKLDIDVKITNDCILGNFSISYLSGYLVYILTVVIPDIYRLKKMKRYVISDLRRLSVYINQMERICIDISITDELLCTRKDIANYVINIASEVERRADCFTIKELDILYKLRTNQYLKILSSPDLTIKEYNESGGFQDYALKFKSIVKEYKQMYQHILINDYSVIVDEDTIRIR